jgi:hypothetical protein
MRRAAIPIILLLVVLSGFPILLDVDEPEEAAPRRAPAPIREPSRTGRSEAPGEAVGPAVPAGALSGMLWQDGGAPVAGLVCRLQTSDRRTVAQTASAIDGAYRLEADAIVRAGTGALLSVNPAPGDDRFRTFDFRLPSRRDRLDVYVPRRGRPRRFDLEIDVLGIRPGENGGAVHVWLQDPRGVTGRWALEPDRSRVVVPGVAEDVHAVGASQGDRVAYLEPTPLSPEGGPVRLRLETGARLTGRVVTSDGRAAAGARLSLVFDAAPRRRLRGQYVYDVATSRHHHVRRLATTDAEGRFRLRGLFPARFALGATHADGVARAAIRVSAIGGEVGLPDLVLEPRTGRVVVDLDLPGQACPPRGDLRLLLIGYAHGARREIAIEAGRSRIEADGLPPDDYAVLAVGVEEDPKTRARFESIVSEFALVRVEPEGRHALDLGSSP